jgi:hypothetical protein
VLPKSDAENWKKELHKSLEKAYTSALATPDNYLGWLGQLDEEYRVTLVGNNKNPDDQLKLLLEEKNPFELFYPHDLLQIMLKSLEKTEPNAFFYNTKVNGKDAQRAYFIRSLTCALLQDFEKPCRKLVTIITSTMFDDESIT